MRKTAERARTYLLCDALTTAMNEIILSVSGSMARDSADSFVSRTEELCEKSRAECFMKFVCKEAEKYCEQVLDKTLSLRFLMSGYMISRFKRTKKHVDLKEETTMKPVK